MDRLTGSRYLSATLLIAGVFWFGSTTTIAQSAEPEQDVLFNCFVEQAREAGADLPQLLIRLEGSLTVDQVIRDGSGKSYRVLLMRMLNEQGIINELSDSSHALIKQLRNHASLTSCEVEDLGINMDQFKKTPYYRMMSGMMGLTHEQMMDPNLMARLGLIHLTSQDLNHPLLKYIALAQFASWLTLDGTLMMYTHQPPERGTPIDRPLPPGVLLTLEQDQPVQVDGKAYSLPELEQLITQSARDGLTPSATSGFWEEIPLLGVVPVYTLPVRLSIANDTPQAQIDEVKKAVKKGRQSVHEELSTKYFEQDFQDLSTEHRQAIEKLLTVVWEGE